MSNLELIRLVFEIALIPAVLIGFWIIFLDFANS